MSKDRKSSCDNGYENGIIKLTFCRNLKVNLELLIMPHRPEHRTEALVKRLNRIEGQLGGVRRMIEEEKPFDEVIIQLNAIKSATQRISQILLEAHTDHTFLNATVEGMDPHKEIESLRRAIAQYSKML